MLNESIYCAISEIVLQRHLRLQIFIEFINRRIMRGIAVLWHSRVYDPISQPVSSVATLQRSNGRSSDFCARSALRRVSLKSASVFYGEEQTLAAAVFGSFVGLLPLSAAIRFRQQP